MNGYRNMMFRITQKRRKKTENGDKSGDSNKLPLSFNDVDAFLDEIEDYLKEEVSKVFGGYGQTKKKKPPHKKGGRL